MRQRYNAVAMLLGIGLIAAFAFLVNQLGVPPAPAERRDKLAQHEMFAEDRDEGEEHADSPNEFYAFQRGIRTRAGEAGPTYPMNYQLKEYLKARGVASVQELNALRKSNRAPLPWIERGPGNVSGRSRSLVVDPADATFNTWFVGSVGGGIWKTSDAGKNWQELTNGLTSLATSTLAMAASNPNVLYAGTGEGFGNVDQISGNGIWKSTDRGQTWQQLASTVNNSFRHVTRVIVDPQNENIVLASTASGFRNDGFDGIFRSTNGGQTWTQVYDAAGISVEQIVANPKNFKTQYATVNGIGVLKSVNGGVTWKASSDGLSGVSRMELAVSPVDTSRLFVSAESGTQAKLYMSDDGGASWALAALNTTDDFLGGQGWYDNAIAAHPFNKDIAFAAGSSIYQFQVQAGTPTTARVVFGVDLENLSSFMGFVNFGGALAGGGIALGTVPAADQPSIEIRFGPGKTQKAHRFTVPAGATSGVPAASYTYQNYVDVPFEVWDIDHNQQLMVSFRDQLADGVFNLDTDTDRTREYIYPQLIPYSATTPSPDVTKNGGQVFKFLYQIWGIVPAGGTWNPATIPAATIRIRWGNLTTRQVTRTTFQNSYPPAGSEALTKGVHPDHHGLWIIPTDVAQQKFKVLNTNDGGVAYSDDNGTTFTQAGYHWRSYAPTSIKGFNTTQFYGVDKMNGADRYVGGTQDNGSWVSPVNPDNKSSWVWAPSGDGFEAVWHYRDPNKIIETSQGGSLRRSLDGGNNWTVVSPAGTGPFISKIGKSKQDADLLFVPTSLGVQRSDNFANSWTLTTMPAGFSGTSSFSQMKISLASPQVVWTGHGMTTTLAPFVSTNGGLSFTATKIFGPSLGSLTGLATHPTDEKTAYALFSISGLPKILRTTDLGQTWTDISGFANGISTNGFPNVATFCLLVMPFDTNTLWAGTEIGIFESKNGGQTWAYADNGLPPVEVWEMAIVNDEVVVATHGRGIWSVSLPELNGYEPLVVTLSPRLREISGGLNGVVNATIGLPSAYDSSFVMVDGAKFTSLGANAEPKELSLLLNIPVTSSRSVKVSLLAYRAGKTFQSTTGSIDLRPLRAAAVKYKNDFNNTEVSSDDFLLDGLDLSVATGFVNGSINSPHPYAENYGDYMALLLQPIIVAAGNATMEYDDVALVEPGESGSIFPNEDFYDYVVVEASSDLGKTWKPLAPGYDATAYTDWLTAFNSNQSGTPAMYKKHTINLLNTFKAGDQIVIRFRLFSDPGTVGWGWVVDNLLIQDNATSVAEETSPLPVTFSLEQNYPNPFNPSTKIKYALPKNADVKIVVYNAYGQRVRTLVDQAKQNAGYHEIVWNGTNDAGQAVASGAYFYKLTTTGFVRTLKMTFVK